jgi:hypothetical protein
MTLERARDKIANCVESLRIASISSAPERLFHYTNSIGVQGILTSKSVWASDFKFLNDRSEVLYASNLIKEHVKKRKDAFSTFVASKMDRFRDTGLLYVASFCDQDDLLSQWRGYSKRADGYSLGFRFDGLLRLSTRNIRLWKLVYDPTEQADVLDQWLDSICKVVSGASVGLSAQDQADLNHHAMKHFLHSIFLLKDPSFKGEREWRLTAGARASLPEKFRIVDGHFVPYVEIPFDETEMDQIRQGPGEYRAANVLALERMLFSHDFRNTKVLKSGVPI